MEIAKQVQYRGDHYQVETVKSMLIEEIEHFERRVTLLKRSQLDRQDSLITTYIEMINVRKEILMQLSQISQM